MRNVVSRVTGKWMVHAPHLWWGDRVDVRFLVADAVRSLNDVRVLDVGCNAGILLSEVPGSSSRVGIDLSIEAIQIARKLDPLISLAVADMLVLPFRDSSFDAVIFCGMLEVPPRGKKENAVQELARVLRSGGEVYLTTLNRKYQRYDNHPYRVDYEELQKLLLPQFRAEIKGFNPFPPFPYFLPNRLLARVPGIWRILRALMEWGAGKMRCSSFLVKAVKR